MSGPTYIQAESIPIVPLYLAAERWVIERDGNLIAVDDERMRFLEGETTVKHQVRFRTLGCWPLTGAIASAATDVDGCSTCAHQSARAAWSTAPCRPPLNARRGRATADARHPGASGQRRPAAFDPPLEICRRRHPKGLYEKADQGKVLNLTGRDQPYEAPEDPAPVLRTAELTAEQAADRVVELVIDRSSPPAGSA